jgi:Uma2 family endonuclease
MAEPALRMSYSEFLHWEQEQEARHEFACGEVFAMAGSTDRHNLVALNIAVILREQLRGKPCRIFMSDVQVRVEAADAAFYPDVMVTCAPEDAAEPRVKRHPGLIVEVLSPSSASFDIGHKFACYRQLQSLQEYVLVDPDRVGIEIFRREVDDRWVLDPVGLGDTLRLACIGVEAPVAAVYQDVP